MIDIRIINESNNGDKNLCDLIHSSDYALLDSCYFEGDFISSLNPTIMYKDCCFFDTFIGFVDTRQFSGCVFQGGSLKQIKTIPSHYSPVAPTKYS